jgi:hypothetical protein
MAACCGETVFRVVGSTKKKTSIEEGAVFLEKELLETNAVVGTGSAEEDVYFSEV